MGIDFGLKRTGIAVTDPLNLFAQPLTTIRTADFPVWFKDYLQHEPVDCVVVGMPIRLTGEDTHSTQSVRDFLQWLKENYPQLKIETIDERFSSHEAQNQIIAMGQSKKDRKDKGLIDTVSATIILQTHLQRIS